MISSWSYSFINSPQFCIAVPSLTPDQGYSSQHSTHDRAWTSFVQDRIFVSLDPSYSLLWWIEYQSLYFELEVVLSI